MLMDSSTLPTQSNMNETPTNADNLAPKSLSENVVPTSFVHTDSVHGSTENESGVQTIEPNAIILAEALTDKTISWQIHNCKITKKTITQDLPLPFLYHYDSLDESIKAAYPLTPALLAQFNTPMTTHEAATLIGINKDALSDPWHVKIIGSLVVFSEALQLAVRLHWTNTGKETQQVYTQDKDEAVVAAFKDWQFFGRVDVLYKNDKQKLVSIDEQQSQPESLLTIDARSDYQQLLPAHALAAIAKLEADKADLPWFDKAILARLE